MAFETRLVEHIVQRMNNDLDLLVEIGRLAPNDAAVIRSRLPVSTTPNTYQTPIQQSLPARIVPPVPAMKPMQQPIMPPVNNKIYAKALWDYNSQTPGDLSFSKGETIEIVHEENEHWFRGRNAAGIEGLLPTNHVEKPHNDALVLSQGNAITKPPTPHIVPHLNGFSPSMPLGNGVSYPLPGTQQQPQQAYNQYPLDEKFNNMSIVPQQHQQQQVMQAPVVAPAKPSKFSAKPGSLKSTLLHAGIGGVGFGAGSAAASELIHGIF